GSDEEASRYRIALARLLQRDPAAAPPAPAGEPKAKDVKTGRLPVPAGAEAPAPPGPLVTTRGQAGGERGPAAAGRPGESIELAKALLQSKVAKTRGEGHLLLGEAYAKMGRRTEGLLEYVKGLELIHPGVATKELARMVQEHPAFQQSDTAARPNPLLAE